MKLEREFMCEDKADSEDIDHLLSELMQMYGTELTTLAYSYTKNVETAKDIVQTVFIKCYQKLNTFQGKASIKTWLYRITINQCKDYLRSSYFRRVIPFGMRIKDNLESGNNTEEIVLRNNTKLQIEECIKRLSSKYRDVLILYYVQELSIKEIVQVLGISNNTVKTRLRRAKEKLLPIIYEEDMFND
ncbi:sigma-70 family RNA polymerase sigma factor [Metabacillus fastidiosus]|uniref:sigma-70 family RNA polymerase sigma factor n=1 Tax=Metabacillus fastidiosus TaxID=1458 RepID=UPI002DB81E86|nr:sigma-70 family RNA polymerase sigma factor [Metabacillus fastidiosus]MEC2074593.1 sigma-70 family RNA polymerase sigma factor [Metabacillus fastidiosus]